MKIFGYNYKVIFKDLNPTGGCHLGRHEFRNQTILIDSEADKEQQLSTLLHEVIEAISSLNDLNLEHNKICVLEVGLYNFLTSNKFGLELIDELNEKVP